ncbi:MAG: HlyD family efflux transporter periplasmic adaptor subunit [Planctomycetes bacterium]|nr:HlyD family efflux transporter periplasmic adaptor subunit [Planctomycetota bacterium]
MQKALVVAGILGAIAAIFWYNLSGGGGLDLFGSHQDEVAGVTVFKARYTQISASVSAPGTVMAAQEVQVPSQINGTVAELQVKEGDAVKQGDLLIKLDARKIESDIRMAEFELKEANAKQVEAETDLTIASRSFEDRKAEVRKLGRSTASIEAAQAEERAQMAELKKAEDNYRRHSMASVAAVGARAIEEAKQAYEAGKAHYEAAQQKAKQAAHDLLNSDLKEERELGEIESKRMRAQASVDTSLQGVARMEEKVKIAREELAKTEIRAPLTGKVIRINVSPNSVVTPGTMNNEPTSLVTVADTSRMMVAAGVDESDISQIEVGQKVQVSMEAFPEVKFAGTVERIAQTADKDQKSNVSTFRVMVLLREPAEGIARLRSGLTAHSEIVTRTKPRALVIKIPAVQSRPATEAQGKPGAPAGSAGSEKKIDPNSKVRVVFVVENERARLRAIKDGVMDESFVEVLDGVADGDSVVVGPGRVLDRLKEGDRVKVELVEP